MESLRCCNSLQFSNFIFPDLFLIYYEDANQFTFLFRVNVQRKGALFINCINERTLNAST